MIARRRVIEPSKLSRIGLNDFGETRKFGENIAQVDRPAPVVRM
jgi:hypothetical protein